MGKKVLIGFFSFCFVLISFFTIRYCNKQTVSSTDICVRAIPLSATIILEIKNYNDFIIKKNNNEIWNNFKKIGLFSKTDSLFFDIDSLIRNDENYSLFKNKKIYLSSHLLGNKTYENLLIFQIESDSEKESIKKILNEKLGSNVKIISRKYSDETINDITYIKNGKTKRFSATISKTFLFIGNSSVVVESAIRQAKSDVSLDDNEAFKKVRNTAGKNVDVNIFVNMENFPLFASNIMSNRLKQKYQNNKKLAEWMELDWNIRSDYLLLNGFISIPDYRNYLHLYKSQNPVSFNIYKGLPATTSMLWAVGLSDFDNYMKNYKTQISHTQNNDSYNKTLDRYKKEFNADIVESFAEFFDKEMAMVFTDINSLDVFENSYVVVNTKSRRLAHDKMMELLNGYAKQKNIDPASLKYEYSIDKETKYDIYRMPMKKIPQILWGNIFSYCEANYFTFYDNNLIFGNSIKSLARYIHPLLLKKTLANDSQFKDFANNLSSSYNFYFYANVSKSYDLISEFSDNSIKSELIANADVLKTIEAVGYQFHSTKDMLYSNLYLNYNPHSTDRPRTVWESFLDTTTWFKPKLVDVHNSSDKRILLQDNSNILYMLNKAGRILWKKQLPEKINSDIFTIDFYENTKLQYAFSSENYIYIIDRIGNFVERFPVKLPSPTQAGMSIFDYDNNRQYRIVVPCADKKIYLYDKNCKIIDGWEFNKTDNIVLTPIQHFRVQNLDYLVFGDRFNTYILDRRGRERIKINEKFEKSPNNFYFYDQIENKDCFITSSIHGDVKQIYFDGDVKTIKIKEKTEKHFFDYKDINADNIADFIFLDKDELEVYDLNKKRILKYNFHNHIDIAPVLYQFGVNNIKIGIVDKKVGHIYLINNDGTLYNGFPLLGVTQFSIGNFNSSSSRFNLLVGSSEKFLYNYEIR
jgi:uncharacterized short protein YbdD (DUF466 family)